jgi:glycosyltransferase involved in cell wall biosynthesis
MPLLKKMEFFIIKKMNYVFVTTVDLKKTLIDQGINKEKIFIIPNAINIKLFSMKISRNLIEKEMNKFDLVDSDFVMLFVGRLTETKGIWFLLNSLNDIITESPEIKLLIIGQGELEKNISIFIKSNNLSNNIKVLGSVDNNKLPLYYNIADIFVFPTHFEGFPAVILEAWACGTPILSTKVPGIQTLITNKVNGLLIQKDNKKELINSINLLKKDYYVRQKLKNNGLEIVKRYSEQNIKTMDKSAMNKIIKLERVSTS